MNDKIYTSQFAEKRVRAYVGNQMALETRVEVGHDVARACCEVLVGKAVLDMASLSPGGTAILLGADHSAMENFAAVQTHNRPLFSRLIAVQPKEGHWDAHDSCRSVKASGELADILRASGKDHASRMTVCGRFGTATWGDDFRLQVPITAIINVNAIVSKTDVAEIVAVVRCITRCSPLLGPPIWPAWYDLIPNPDAVFVLAQMPLNQFCEAEGYHIRYDPAISPDVVSYTPCDSEKSAEKTYTEDVSGWKRHLNDDWAAAGDSQGAMQMGMIARSGGFLLRKGVLVAEGRVYNIPRETSMYGYVPVDWKGGGYITDKLNIGVGALHPVKLNVITKLVPYFAGSATRGESLEKAILDPDNWKRFHNHNLATATTAAVVGNTMISNLTTISDVNNLDMVYVGVMTVIWNIMNSARENPGMLDRFSKWLHTNKELTDLVEGNQTPILTLTTKRTERVVTDPSMQWLARDAGSGHCLHDALRMIGYPYRLPEEIVLTESMRTALFATFGEGSVAYRTPTQIVKVLEGFDVSIEKMVKSAAQAAVHVAMQDNATFEQATEAVAESIVVDLETQINTLGSQLGLCGSGLVFIRYPREWHIIPYKPKRMENVRWGPLLAEFAGVSPNDDHAYCAHQDRIGEYVDRLSQRGLGCEFSESLRGHRVFTSVSSKSVSYLYTEDQSILVTINDIIHLAEEQPEIWFLFAMIYKNTIFISEIGAEAEMTVLSGMPAYNIAGEIRSVTGVRTAGGFSYARQIVAPISTNTSLSMVFPDNVCERQMRLHEEKALKNRAAEYLFTTHLLPGERLVSLGCDVAGGLYAIELCQKQNRPLVLIDPKISSEVLLAMYNSSIAISYCESEAAFMRGEYLSTRVSAQLLHGKELNDGLPIIYMPALTWCANSMNFLAQYEQVHSPETMHQLANHAPVLGCWPNFAPTQQLPLGTPCPVGAVAVGDKVNAGLPPFAPGAPSFEYFVELPEFCYLFHYPVVAWAAFVREFDCDYRALFGMVESVVELPPRIPGETIRSREARIGAFVEGMRPAAVVMNPAILLQSFGAYSDIATGTPDAGIRHDGMFKAARIFSRKIAFCGHVNAELEIPQEWELVHMPGSSSGEYRLNNFRDVRNDPLNMSLRGAKKRYNANPNPLQTPCIVYRAKDLMFVADQLQKEMTSCGATRCLAHAFFDQLDCDEITALAKSWHICDADAAGLPSRLPSIDPRSRQVASCFRYIERPNRSRLDVTVLNQPLFQDQLLRITRAKMDRPDFVYPVPADVLQKLAEKDLLNILGAIAGGAKTNLVLKVLQRKSKGNFMFATPLKAVAEEEAKKHNAPRWCVTHEVGLCKLLAEDVRPEYIVVDESQLNSAVYLYAAYALEHNIPIYLLGDVSQGRLLNPFLTDAEIKASGITSTDMRNWEKLHDFQRILEDFTHHRSFTSFRFGELVASILRRMTGDPIVGLNASALERIIHMSGRGMLTKAIAAAKIIDPNHEFQHVCLTNDATEQVDRHFPGAMTATKMGGVTKRKIIFYDLLADRDDPSPRPNKTVMRNGLLSTHLLVGMSRADTEFYCFTEHDAPHMSRRQLEVVKPSMLPRQTMYFGERFAQEGMPVRSGAEDVFNRHQAVFLIEGATGPYELTKVLSSKLIEETRAETAKKRLTTLRKKVRAGQFIVPADLASDLKAIRPPTGVKSDPAIAQYVIDGTRVHANGAVGLTNDVANLLAFGKEQVYVSAPKIKAQRAAFVNTEMYDFKCDHVYSLVTGQFSSQHLRDSQELADMRFGALPDFAPGHRLAGHVTDLAAMINMAKGAPCRFRTDATAVLRAPKQIWNFLTSAHLKQHGLTNHTAAENLYAAFSRYHSPASVLVYLKNLPTDKVAERMRELDYEVRKAAKLLCEAFFTKHLVFDFEAEFERAHADFAAVQSSKGESRRFASFDKLPAVGSHFEEHIQAEKIQSKAMDVWKAITAGLFALKCGQPTQMCEIERTVLDVFLARLITTFYGDAAGANFSWLGQESATADVFAKMKDFTGTPDDPDSIFDHVGDKCKPIPEEERTYGDIPHTKATNCDDLPEWARLWLRAVGVDIVQCDASHDHLSVILIVEMMAMRTNASDAMLQLIADYIWRVISSWTASDRGRTFKFYVLSMLPSGASLTYILNCFHSLKSFALTLVDTKANEKIGTHKERVDAACAELLPILKKSFAAFSGDDAQLLLWKELAPFNRTHECLSPTGVGLKISAEPGAVIFCHAIYSPWGVARDAFRAFLKVLEHPAGNDLEMIAEHKMALFSEYGYLRDSEELRKFACARLMRFGIEPTVTAYEIDLIMRFCNTPAPKLAKLREAKTSWNINQFYESMNVVEIPQTEVYSSYKIPISRPVNPIVPGSVWQEAFTYNIAPLDWFVKGT